MKILTYRDAGIVLTRRGKEDAAAKSFVEFEKSSEGQRIFAKWGWIAGTRRFTRARG